MQAEVNQLDLKRLVLLLHQRQMYRVEGQRAQRRGPRLRGKGHQQLQSREGKYPSRGTYEFTCGFSRVFIEALQLRGEDRCLHVSSRVSVGVLPCLRGCPLGAAVSSHLQRNAAQVDLKLNFPSV